MYICTAHLPPQAGRGDTAASTPQPPSPQPCHHVPRQGLGGTETLFLPQQHQRAPCPALPRTPSCSRSGGGAGGGDWGAASQSFDQGCTQAPPTQRDPPSCHPWLGVQPGRIGGAGQCLDELQPLPKPIQGVQTPRDPPKNFISLPLSSSLASRRPQNPPRPASTSSITAAAPPRRWGERKPPAPATGRS